jgi:hypothetical protein
MTIFIHNLNSVGVPERDVLGEKLMMGHSSMRRSVYLIRSMSWGSLGYSVIL